MRKLKNIVALVLSVICCLSTSTVAFAAESISDEEISATTDEAVQPRVGIAGYHNHLHNGSYETTFVMETSSLFWPMKEFTVETSGFNEDTIIKLYIYSSKGLAATFTGEGNAKWPNRGMNDNFVNGDTYTIKCTVNNPNDDGWVGVWIY